MDGGKGVEKWVAIFSEFDMISVSQEEIIKVMNEKKIAIPATGALKKACGYILQVKRPLYTLVKISEMLTFRELEILFLQMQRYDSSDGTGVVILHCRLEKDKIKFIAGLLKKIPGVEKVEWMEDTKRTSSFK